MSCIIVINQQISSFDLDRVTSEAKLKDPKHVEAVRKSQ